VYVANADVVMLHELAWPVSIVLALTAILLGITALIYRSIHRASLPTAAAIFIFLTFGQWRQVVWYLTMPLNTHQAQAVAMRLLILQGLILAWIAYLAAFRIKQPRIWTLRLNQFSSVLLCCPLVLWTARKLDTHWPSGLPGSNSAQALQIHPAPSAQADYPDIYLIIADAHGRQDILRSMYDYDDGPFLQHLRDKGFFVAAASHGNYAYTELSVASMLNLRYLSEFNNLKLTTWEPLMPLLRHSTLVAILKGLGFRYVTFETALEDLCLPNSDDYISQPDRYRITPFQQLLLDTTLLSQFGGEKLKRRLMGPQPDLFQEKRQIILFELAQAPNAVKLRGPKFVFLHLLCPHAPFVFAVDGSDPVQRGYGSYIDPGLNVDYTVDMYRDWYAQQARYIDGRLSNMIDEILAESAKPPTIVLISDHGPRSEVKWANDNPKDSNLNECMSNLTAIYLPPRPGFAGTASETGGLYSSITPVNIFRVILNDYFDAGLTLLPDKVYFSCPWPFAFHDVTSDVRRGNSDPKRKPR
jgi:hypothetical protein